MTRLIQCIMATICLETLAIYQFLCISRIINKEWIVEKIWKIITDKEFKETLVFIVIRPVFLQISLITYMFSVELLSNIMIFNLMLYFTPILAIGTGITNNKKK